jgi:hypothetical protein
MQRLRAWTSWPLFATRPWRTERGQQGYAVSSRAAARTETFEVRCGSAGSVTVEYVFLFSDLLFVPGFCVCLKPSCRSGVLGVGVRILGHVISDFPFMSNPSLSCQGIVL